MKGERRCVSAKRRVAGDYGRGDRQGRWACGEVGRRGGQMVQHLTDLAAIFVVDRQWRRVWVAGGRSGLLPGEDEIVVVPAEEDRLEQHREEAEPRG